MKTIILVAHGKLAIEMKHSAEMIFGSLPDFSAVEFCKEDGLETIKEKIITATSPEAKEVIIFTDLFCGTPYNAGCAVCLEQTEKNYEVLSGMSLPLVLEMASMLYTATSQEIIEHCKEAAATIVRSFKDQVIDEEEDF